MAIVGDHLWQTCLRTRGWCTAQSKASKEPTTCGRCPKGVRTPAKRWHTQRPLVQMGENRIGRQHTVHSTEFRFLTEGADKKSQKAICITSGRFIGSHGLVRRDGQSNGKTVREMWKVSGSADDRTDILVLAGQVADDCHDVVFVVRFLCQGTVVPAGNARGQCRDNTCVNEACSLLKTNKLSDSVQLCFHTVAESDWHATLNGPL
jgi:hypothetical protein